MYDEDDKEDKNQLEEFKITDASIDWNQIYEDIGLVKDISKSDEKQEINSSLYFIRQEEESYFQFDKEFLSFLNNFVSIQKKKEIQKLWLKGFFFACIMLGFFVLIVTPCIIVLYAADLSEISVIVAMVSVLVELVSAIIVLPKIIAEYLFNKEEDKNMMEIIKSMQNYNERKHDHLS